MENALRTIQKLLLMGRPGAGKTSIHSIIFANYPARDTSSIGCTPEAQECRIRFLGQLTLDLWDCGGQDKFMQQWFTTRRDEIFSRVHVLIYVFDVQRDAQHFEKDLNEYRLCIENLHQVSPDAKVFVLVHKLDKLPPNTRQSVLSAKCDAIGKVSQGIAVQNVFGTSIWDETLYTAWSQIVQYLIPGLAAIKRNLKSFCTLCNCDEVVLFEKETFLIIASEEASQYSGNVLRYERVSNIVKQFKLSCMRMHTQIKSMRIKNANFTAVIQEFTRTTYIMLVFRDLLQGTIDFNLQSAQSLFEGNKSERQNLLFDWGEA